MKRWMAIPAILSLVAVALHAQEPKRVFTRILPSPVMGKTVKGAPYSADEINESQQTLADGTRISNQSQVTVYRDAAGRVRRETPDQVTIWDPVENVSYTLDPKSRIAHKSSLGRTNVLFVGGSPIAGAASTDATFTYSTGVVALTSEPREPMG